MGDRPDNLDAFRDFPDETSHSMSDEEPPGMPRRKILPSPAMTK
jgi:hypothetical protein